MRIDPALIEASDCAVLDGRPFRDSPADLLQASRSLLREGHSNEFRIADDPTQGGARRELAGAAYAKGMFDDALSLFTEVLDENPLDYQSWCLQGHIYFLRMELDSALTSYRSAALVALTPHPESIEPTQYPDRLLPGLTDERRDDLVELLELGEADAAALLSFRVVGDEVESRRWGASSLAGIARTLGDMGDTHGAFIAAKGAHDLDPSRVETTYELAIRADVGGIPEVAQRAMVGALRLDPVLVLRLLAHETRIQYPSEAVDIVIQEARTVRHQMRGLRDEAFRLAGGVPHHTQPDAHDEGDADLLSVMGRNQLVADELQNALGRLPNAMDSQAATQEAAIARSVDADRSSARSTLFSMVDIDPWMVWAVALVGLGLLGRAFSGGSSAGVMVVLLAVVLGGLTLASVKGRPRSEHALSGASTPEWQAADRLRETARAVLSDPLAGSAVAAEPYQDYALVLEGAGDRAFEVARYVQELLGGDFSRARRIVAGAPVVVMSAPYEAHLEQARRRLEGHGARVQIRLWTVLREEQRWR
ncbi:MAG: hypothetical protein WEA29_09805 [Acidimicrobiia bacterium]